MQANSWHYKLFNFHLFFNSRNCKKEGKKLQKLENLDKGKRFLKGSIIWCKNKKLIDKK